MEAVPRPRPPNLHRQVTRHGKAVVRPHRQGASRPHPQRLWHTGILLRVSGGNSRIAGSQNAQGRPHIARHIGLADRALP